MVAQYLGNINYLEHSFDEKCIDTLARSLGSEVAAFWKAVKQAARKEAERNQQ